MRNIDECSFVVTWSEADGEYVGLCEEFPSLSHLASTQEDAIGGITELVASILDEGIAS